MTDLAVARRYRRIRAKHGTPVVHAMRWARQPDATDVYPELEWAATDEGLPRANGRRVAGFDVTAWAQVDADPLIDGAFSDTWEPGAIQHPDWRPHMHGSDRVLRWYTSACGTVEERREWLHRAGHSRHDAWLIARRQMLDDLRREADPEHVTLHARVYRAGVLLGEADLHGFDVTNADDANEQIACSLVTELLPEALDSARLTLTRLLEEDAA